MSKKFTKKDFIKKAQETHGDKYDYSKVEYVDSYTKVKIICKEHGIFEQEANSHIRGSGCKECRNVKLRLERRSSLDDFINKSSLIHENKYDYSIVKYVNVHTKVKIICPIHGEFEQSPANHLKKHGCKKCGDIMTGKNLSHENLFIENSKKINQNKYDYSKTKYKNNQIPVEIICKEHGSFFQLPSNHIHKQQGCPKCTNHGFSKIERDISDFISLFETVSNNIKINKTEFDIFCKNKNIAFEFNGLYWHSDKFKKNNYHISKTEIALNNNIRLIHIFEDEWVDKNNIVKSRIKNILGYSNKIYARKCEIREVSSQDSTKFLDENHIQGKVGSNIKIGLYYDNELVSLMTFGGLRRNLGSTYEEGKYELLRFCNKLNTSVIGGASKLLKYFEKTYKPKEIISYADRRWSEGNLYHKLGFDFVHYSEPNYFYVNKLKRENRFKYRKSELVKQGFDENKTEKQIMEERGYSRIYDCGTIKFIKNCEKN